jgi:MFS transporter, FSR family, fosmidomycin resistance protein
MNDFATAGRGRIDVEVISLMGFAHGTSHFFHLMLPSLFPWLMRDFALNFTRAGSLTAAFFVASGIGQALAGFVVDRVGALRVLWAGIGLFSVAGVVLGSANSYGTLLAAAVLAGTGNSVFHPADFTTLNQRVSAPRLGHAFSVHSLSGNLGWAAGPVFMTGVAAATNWRLAAFAAAAIALVALTVLVSRRGILAGTASGHHRVAARDATAGASVFAFLGVGAVWMCFLFFLVTMLAFGALQNFAPAVLQRVYGVSLAAAASALTLYLLGGAAGVVVGGFLAAKNSAHDRVVAIALVFAALTALAVASGALPPWSVGAFFTIIGFCTGIASPSRDLLVRKAAMERFGQQSFGRIYGFVYSGLDVGLATAPLVFGRMMDKSMFSAVLGGVALLQGIGIAAALKVGQQRPKEQYLLKPLPPKRD